MKIVCDACQAKYSISDDKVQGKVFKIRCKKCSNIIVVRGGAGQEAAPAPQEKDTRVYDYGYEGGGGGAAEGGGEDAVWHLVINQDQVGPMTVAEVEAKFAAGEVDAETFTWREGFADWLPLAQVDAFAGLVASGSTTNAGSTGGADAVANMFGTSASADDVGTTRSDPGDLFAAASGGSRPKAEEDDGDLFGSKPAASSSSSSSSSSAAANSKLKGERNENSVLFSLNNLAQLASDSRPAPSSSSSSGGGSAPAGHATGSSGGEGSGLIDIRSMASAYMGGGGGNAGAAKPATASSGIGSVDDLPVFGGGGFSEPAVIMPVASRGGRDNKMMLIMIGAIGLLAVIAVVMLVLLLKGGDDKKPAQVAQGTGTEEKKDPGTDEKKEPAIGGTDEKKEPETGGTDEKKEPATGGTDEKKEPASGGTETKEPKTGGTTPKTGGGTSTPKTGGGTTTPKTGGGTTTPKTGGDTPKTGGGTTTPPSGGGGGCDEVSCVLNNYEGSCCAKFKKTGGGGGGGGGGGTTSKPKSDLPDGLDRAMISSGIANVKARVSACGDKSPAKGKVKVKVSVSGDGRVSNVAVETTPDPALGACVAAAVQKASFGKTQNGGSFSYPFVF